MFQLQGRMRARAAEPALSASTLFLSIDHRFIAPELDDLAQDVYDALGALDAAAPAAIAPVAPEDVFVLVAASERWADTLAVPSPGMDAVRGATRRMRHLLERS